MYKVIFYLVVSLLTLNTYAQTSTTRTNTKGLNTSKDSIYFFYDKLFDAMKNGYAYKDSVDWKEIELQIHENLKQHQNFQSSLKEVTTLFDFAKADHCKLEYNNASFAGNFPGPSKKDFSEQWVKKYDTKPSFEVKVLSDSIGYILMPGIIYRHDSSKKIQSIAQPMYNEINAVKNSNKIKGWIIDLRFNTGGNCQPMLLALYDFLGDNEVWGVLNLDKKKIRSVQLNKGKYIDESQKIGQIKIRGPLLDKTKVAVITNLATGSSGEVTALAFKGRDNTIFIGEKTNGKTTANMIVDLPFGAYMTLSTGFDCDRNGNFYKHIVPDITISKQDNFNDLVLDKNIQEAIKFINSPK